MLKIIALYVLISAIAITVLIVAMLFSPEKLDFMSQFYIEEPRKVWGITVSYRAQIAAAFVGFIAFYIVLALSVVVTAPVFLPLLVWEMAFGGGALGRKLNCDPKL